MHGIHLIDQMRVSACPLAHAKEPCWLSARLGFTETHSSYSDMLATCTPVQVAEGMQPSHPDQFTYTTVQVQDTPSEDLVAHFAKCFAAIDDARAQGGGWVPPGYH